MLCPACGTESQGRFCPNCAAPLKGAMCAACRSELTPGAKYCHRCGTPASAPGLMVRTPARSNALPWSVAAIALLSLVALAAGQRFGRSRPEGNAPASDAVPMRAPDISALSPSERAERLYDRIMSAAERGRMDSVQFFLPMAIQAYENLGALTLDQRYDVGRLAEVGGDARVLGAQADTILRADSKHLLGLLLASRAARLRGDSAAMRGYLSRFVASETAERKRQLPEYLLHQNDIDEALAEWRRRGGGGGGGR